MPTETGGTIQK